MASPALVSCSDDDDSNYNTWETYRQWRTENQEWVAAQEALIDEETGQPYYTKVVPAWAPSTFVLMHWFNDRTATEGNLTPLLTSWITTHYDLYLCDDTEVDSSAELEAGRFTSQLSGLIDGWQIALMNMHVGDTVQIVVPYEAGYGNTSSELIPPYSALRFNLRLVDIPDYEIRP